MIRSTALAVAALCAVTVFAQSAFADDTTPFVHLQADKGSYRLGETLWLRVHLGERAAQAFPLRVELARGGEALAKRTYATPAALQRLGDLGEKILIGSDWLGGAYHLRAFGPKGRRLHDLPLKVYATARPALRLRLRVLGDLYQPSERVTATCRVRDQTGRPVRGVRLRARATFGPLSVETESSVTDREGWASVRFAVPAEARGDGFLSVGLKKGKSLAAVAARVPVSASVGRIDAFPEGGAIVTGHPQRLALYARDLDGQPTRAEGRILDDLGRSVATFQADRYGHAMIEVPYAKDRRYHAVVDRPSVVGTFPLPKDTGHAVSLRIQAEEGKAVSVKVRVRKGQKLPKLEVRLASQTAFGHMERVKPGKGVSLPLPKTLRARWILITHKDRALLKAPLLIGKRWPFEVTIKPREGQALLPGRVVKVDVKTTFSGRPVSADLALSVFNAAARPQRAFGVVPALAARSVLQPCVHAGVVADGADLFDWRAETWNRRHAFLLVRGGYALPPGGVALPENDAVLPADVGRASIPPMKPRPPLVVKVDGTKRRLTGLDLLMARAPWTRPGKLRPSDEPTVKRSLPLAKRDATPGLGKAARKAPQAERIGWRSADTRDTVFWQANLRTNAQGEAQFAFRLNHELTPLAIEAQGTANGAAAVGVAEIEPQSEVETTFSMPEILRLGDTVDLWVSVNERDGRKVPYTLTVQAPACLKALERTQVQRDPRRHNASTKFRFQAVSLKGLSELRVIVARGAFVEVHRRPFQVQAAEPTLSVAAYGLTKGSITASLSVPRDALPGSVVARGKISPSRLSSAVEGLESILREPHGCFEQTTSSNYPNLLVLEALLSQGADPALLERAYVLSTAGFERIKSFQHPDGGFSLWGPKQGKGQAAHYTAMGIVQLARYAALFDGRGRVEVQRGLDWLDRQGDLPPTRHLFTAVAVTEAGFPWKGVGPAKAIKPKTHYERALQANLFVLLEEAQRPQEKLDALLGQLAAALESKPQEGLKGAAQARGIMGSCGRQLSVETTALALTAFAATKRTGPAADCEAFLMATRAPQGGWHGTQATAMAIRALATGAGRAPVDPIPVTLRAHRMGKVAGILGFQRVRPLSLVRALPGLEPGQPVRLSLALRAKTELPYTLSCTYRVAKPTTSPDSPYRMVVRSPAVIDAGGHDEVVISIQRRPGTALPSGQVVAHIQLPGGLRIRSGEDGARALELGKASHFERKAGGLVVYWTQALDPKGTLVLRIPVEGVTEGRYRTAHSVIYPYYRSGLECYAKGRDLRVMPNGSSAPTGTGPVGQAGQATQAGSGR
jgi:hypothetical protein